MWNSVDIPVVSSSQTVSPFCGNSMEYCFVGVTCKMTAAYTNRMVHRVAVLIAYASYASHTALPFYTRYLTYTMAPTSLWLNAGYTYLSLRLVSTGYVANALMVFESLKEARTLLIH